jgi:LysR family transcriptional regulator, transcription activator of glutamate synthase operon
MDIRQIRYFLTIAKTGNFSIAADELNISQSSFSKQIIALEKELGCQLIDRSKRKVSLTEVGEHFLKYALQIDETYNSMLVDIEKYRSDTPRLSIASIPVVAQYGIYKFIAEYRNLYPWIRFQVEEQETLLAVQGLNAQQYDLAFLPSSFLDPSQHGWIEISSDVLAAVFSNKHHFASRKSISLAELSRENFIAFFKGLEIHELVVKGCRAAGFEPRFSYTSYRTESVSSLVASNVGIALMMQKVIEYYQQPDIVIVPLEEKIESKIVLAYLKYRKNSQAATMFLDLVKKMLV